jgi:hypothetical protein
MEKFGRKPSNDPVQEQLRQSKAVWNKEVSAFIGDLINFKKLMNGWPNKFHMEKSFIKDPIPSDPNTILGVLAADFQELAQKGAGLIEKQVEYSKKRKQKQLKPPSGGAPITTDLAQQLSAASADYQLIAEGSNPFSRFYSSLKGPWFGGSPEARARKYRLSMLRTGAVLVKELRRFEAQILGSSGESIFVASKYLIQIENHIKFINNALSAFVGANTSTSISASLPEKSTSKATAEAMAEDFEKNYGNFVDMDRGSSEKLSKLVLQMMDPAISNNAIYDEVIATYKKIIDDLNHKNNTNGNSLKEILMTKKASIEVVAQNIVNKWLGKVKHNISPFDKTSAIRLDISKASEELRTILDHLMNSLEKSISPEEIVNSVKEMNEKYVYIKELMGPLEDTIRGQLFDKTFVGLLENKQLTDYPSNLSNKEREHLQRMLQTRQFRDVTNLYGKK